MLFGDVTDSQSGCTNRLERIFCFIIVSSRVESVICPYSVDTNFRSNEQPIGLAAFLL